MSTKTLPEFQDSGSTDGIGDTTDDDADTDDPCDCAELREGFPCAHCFIEEGATVEDAVDTEGSA